MMLSGNLSNPATEIVQILLAIATLADLRCLMTLLKHRRLAYHTLCRLISCNAPNAFLCCFAGVYSYMMIPSSSPLYILYVRRSMPAFVAQPLPPRFCSRNKTFFRTAVNELAPYFVTPVPLLCDACTMPRNLEEAAERGPQV